MPKEATCPICDNAFVSRHNAKFCSEGCRRKHRAQVQIKRTGRMKAEDPEKYQEYLEKHREYRKRLKEQAAEKYRQSLTSRNTRRRIQKAREQSVIEFSNRMKELEALREKLREEAKNEHNEQVSSSSQQQR